MIVFISLKVILLILLNIRESVNERCERSLFSIRMIPKVDNSNGEFVGLIST